MHKENTQERHADPEPTESRAARKRRHVESSSSDSQIQNTTTEQSFEKGSESDSDGSTTSIPKAKRGPAGHLTKEQALEIYALRPEDADKAIPKRGIMLGCREIGVKYGVTPKSVRDIWRGRSWSDATGHPRNDRATGYRSRGVAEDLQDASMAKPESAGEAAMPLEGYFSRNAPERDARTNLQMGGAHRPSSSEFHGPSAQEDESQRRSTLLSGISLGNLASNYPMEGQMQFSGSSAMMTRRTDVSQHWGLSHHMSNPSTNLPPSFQLLPESMVYSPSTSADRQLGDAIRHFHQVQAQTLMSASARQSSMSTNIPLYNRFQVNPPMPANLSVPLFADPPPPPPMAMGGAGGMLSSISAHRNVMSMPPSASPANISSVHPGLSILPPSITKSLQEPMTFSHPAMQPGSMLSVARLLPHSPLSSAIPASGGTGMLPGQAPPRESRRDVSGHRQPFREQDPMIWEVAGARNPMCNGRYLELHQEVNGKPSLAKAEQDVAIWQSPANRWIIGPLANIGTNAGYCYTLSSLVEALTEEGVWFEGDQRNPRISVRAVDQVSQAWFQQHPARGR